MIKLSYEGLPFTTDDRLYAESAAFTSGRLNRYEFGLDDEEFEDWEPEELAISGEDGIPVLDDYLRADRVEVLKRGESRIDLGSVSLRPLAEVKAGDVVVFIAPSLGNLVAEVEAGEYTTWDPARGWLSVNTSDGFEVTLEMAGPQSLVEYVGVR